MSAFEDSAALDYAEPQSAWLDRQTGEVLWIYDSDEDAHMVINIPPEENRALHERVAAEPARYLEIQGLDGRDHNRILRDFLRSDWTGDVARRQRAADAYTGRIGEWKRRIDDRETIHAYHAFRDRRVEELAEEYLREEGIEPRWR